ncbi:MAG: HisA/HisF-related TIM barrel protein, partial [Candidatus Methanomethyliaceae archaeon]
IIYYEDPLFAAKKWEEEGAELLHIIDLDAALGIGNNYDVIKRIIKEIKIPIQVGGGIRNLEIAKNYLDIGAERVILGTAALELNIIRNALINFGSDRIMAAVDHVMGRVAIKGWKELLELNAELLCKNLIELGVKKILMTSIDRDGTLKGPNLAYSLRIASSLPAEFYLAGGFSRIEEIISLKRTNIAGVIIGRALYEGLIDFKKAKEVLKIVN